MSTSTYGRKRDFSRTPEPRDRKQASRPKGKRMPRFVIQKHDASNQHYDLRVEEDGVLKSWAVPKGPSTDPRERRLAIPTEDHPLDYADFEGVVPEDQYGGGIVLIWDRGSYENMTEKGGRLVPMKKALEDGHALIKLHGRKLTGGYALQRTGNDQDAQWLLIKLDDADADARRNPVSTQPKSVASDRTIEEIAAAAADD